MGHRFVRLTGGVDGVLELGELHFAEGQQDMVFAGKMVEERALADVGDVGNVFNGGFGEALFSEEFERSAEEPFADFCAATLAAVRCWRLTRGGILELVTGALVHNDLWP